MYHISLSTSISPLQVTFKFESLVLDVAAYCLLISHIFSFYGKEGDLVPVMLLSLVIFQWMKSCSLPLNLLMSYTHKKGQGEQARIQRNTWHIETDLFIFSSGVLIGEKFFVCCYMIFHRKNLLVVMISFIHVFDEQVSLQ